MEEAGAARLAVSASRHAKRERRLSIDVVAVYFFRAGAIAAAAKGNEMGRHRSGLLAALLCSGLVVGVESLAAAQASPPVTAPTQATPTVQISKADANDPVERARVHYERGLQLFNEENYDAALFEFERAYELAPTYRILYNMGRIQRQQNNYASAMRSYARYLKEGGEGVPADRRVEVERELGILKPRVALVTVKVNVDGADVYADDIPVCTATIESSCVGKSPLRSPIIVNGGRHKVTATKPGFAPATALVSVVGSDTIDITLDLVSYDRPPAPPSNPWTVPTVVGWTATGAAAITAGVFGVLALSAKNKQQTRLDDPTATSDDLKNGRDKAHTLATVSDVLWVTTGVFAGVSAYFTFRMIGAKQRGSATTGSAAAVPAPRPLDLVVSPMGFSAVGTF